MPCLKFMLSFKEEVGKRLQTEASALGVSVQEYLRGTIIPFYFKFEPYYVEKVKEVIDKTVGDPMDFRKNREGAVRP